MRFNLWHHNTCHHWFIGKNGWVAVPIVLVIGLFSLLRGRTQRPQLTNNHMQGVCLDNLLPKRPNNDFGHAVVMGNGVAAISEPSADRVHVFRVRGKSWSLANLITHPEPGGTIYSQPRSVGQGFCYDKFDSPLAIPQDSRSMRMVLFLKVTDSLGDILTNFKDFLGNNRGFTQENP
jgi:hypothetical protein